MLFRQNGYPVVAIEGDPSTLPALTRTLSATASDGIDVKMLETMLHVGGFDKGAALTIDDHFDTNTGKAVAAWWKSLGITADAATVSVPPGSFVVVPGGLYAGKALVADGGATVGNPVVLPLTTASRQITTTAPVGDTTFTLGAHIEVLYPDNTTGTGTIVNVGTVASNASNTPGATPTGRAPRWWVGAPPKPSRAPIGSGRSRPAAPPRPRGRDRGRGDRPGSRGHRADPRA